MDARRMFKPDATAELTLPEPVELPSQETNVIDFDKERAARVLARQGVAETTQVDVVPYESPLNEPVAMEQAKQRMYGLPIDAKNLGESVPPAADSSNRTGL